MITLSDFFTQLLMLWAQFTSQFLGSKSYVANTNCNYYQNMAVGVSYYVYNKEYPNNYGPWQSCKWTLVSSPGTQISLNCSLNIQSSSSCTSDKFLVSTLGDPNLGYVSTLCGKGNFSATSIYNNMTIGFRSGLFTSGGTFLCKATTVPVSSTTTSTTTMASTSLTTATITPNCNCGWKNTNRIVGGVPTLSNEYPSMAGLYDVVIQDLYCGATVVSTRYAITAAHCLTNKQATAVALVVGCQNVSQVGSPGTQFLLLTNFIRHPLYNDSDPLALNDIALVQTQKDIVFSDTVGPVCLPFKFISNLFTGQTATFTGWGTTLFTGPKSDTLLKTTVTVQSPTDCATSVNGTANQICTYTQGHDACQGDSGGPLYWTDPSTFKDQLIGIISYGFGCGGPSPGVNTRVTSYLSWILQVTPDAAYCYN